MKNLCFILSSLVGFFTCAQKASVSLSVDAKSVQIGDVLSFTVKSNMEGQVELSFPPEFVQGYGSTNGMEQVMDYNSGTVSTIYYFSQNGTFKENGKFTIQAFVKSKKTVYKSNKVTVVVEKESNEDDPNAQNPISKKNLKQPIFGIIKKSKSQIYEGESVVLESKVYSRLSINMLEQYAPFELDGGAQTEEIDKSKNLLLTRENYKGTNFLTFSYGKQLVFPNSTGKIKVKPFEMALQYDDGGIFSERVSFRSNCTHIEVLPLPTGAPKDFIGAVGKFSMDCSLDKTYIKQGDVAVLTIEISGVGNLQNTDKPLLSLPKGIKIYGDPEVKEDFTYTSQGADGKISYKYNLQFNSSAASKLNPISISYFDPSTKEYIQVKKRALNFKVQENPQIKEAVASLEKPSEQAVSEEPILVQKPSTEKPSFYTSQWFWPSVLSPLFIAFIGGLFYFKKNDKSDKKKANLQCKSSLNKILHELNALEKTHQEDLKTAFYTLENTLKSLGNALTGKQNCMFSKAEILNELSKNEHNVKWLDKVNAILTSCEEARFSYQADEAKFKVLLAESKQVVAGISS